MPLLFFLFFIAAPVLELWVLIQVGSEIGALATIALLVLAALAGLALVRYEGAATLLRATQRLNRGELPTREMGEGLLIGVAGLLLLLPGFISDAVALVLLVPLLRRWVLRRLTKRMTVVHRGRPQHHHHQAPPHQPDGQTKGHTIEGEYRRED